MWGGKAAQLRVRGCSVAAASDLLLELGLRGEALGALVEVRRLAISLAREADDVEHRRLADLHRRLHRRQPLPLDVRAERGGARDELEQLRVRPLARGLVPTHVVVVVVVVVVRPEGGRLGSLAAALVPAVRAQLFVLHALRDLTLAQRAVARILRIVRVGREPVVSLLLDDFDELTVHRRVELVQVAVAALGERAHERVVLHLVVGLEDLGQLRLSSGGWDAPAAIVAAALAASVEATAALVAAALAAALVAATTMTSSISSIATMVISVAAIPAVATIVAVATAVAVATIITVAAAVTIVVAHPFSASSISVCDRRR